MKRLCSLCLVGWLAAIDGYADPAHAAIVAIMRLSEQPNYSWVASVSDDARTYDIFGKTVRGGYTQVKMPVINSVRRQLGRSVTDTHIELIFRGNVDCVIETEDGWRKPAELPLLASNSAETPRSSGASARASGFPRASVQGATIHPPIAADRQPAPAAYSNLQLGISHPHEELGVIVGSHREFNVEGDVVTGALTDLGAQLLLVRDGQKDIDPVSATGTFKIWVRDGIVTRYQVVLTGTLDVHFESGRRDVEVHQLTDTILKDVGTTEVDVPAAARVKLGM
jgi:hypothetical protein